MEEKKNRRREEQIIRISDNPSITDRQKDRQTDRQKDRYTDWL